MSTEYKIAERDGVELSVIEHSGVLDLDVNFTDEAATRIANDIYGYVTLVERCQPEEMAEIAINILRAVLYNCGDPEKYKRWIHRRVDEADFSTTQTKIDEM